MDKAQLRKKIINERLQLSPEQVSSKSKKIISTLFSMDFFDKARMIMYYVDMRNEVKTKKAIAETLALGKRVVVPKVKKERHLLVVEINGLGDLAPGVFGILEPVKEIGTEPKQIDIVIVPGVAFDKQGYRLGYGGGFYDNFLPKLHFDAMKIAICYEFQVMNHVPIEPHDVPVDMILTEENIYTFKNHRQ